MSGKNILLIILVPLALAVPVILVKVVVRDTDPTIPEELLRNYKVGTVEYYGVRLDEKASPRDVVYVLLSAVKDNFEAAKAPTRQEQSEGVRKAREIQLAVAAPTGIMDLFLKGGAVLPGKDPEKEREKLILRTVLGWARTVGFYVDGIDLSRRDTWLESIDKSNQGGPERATVRLEASKGRFQTVIVVQLIKESAHWRIYLVTLGSKMPRIMSKPIQAPTSAPKPVVKKPVDVPSPAAPPAAKPSVPKAAPPVPPTPPATKPSTPEIKPAAAPPTPKPAPPAAPATAPAAVSKPAVAPPPPPPAKPVAKPETSKPATQPAAKAAPAPAATAPVKAPASSAAKPATTSPATTKASG
ncbi:MAG: hypothetical protein JXQ73_08785 [Phycisphaerae bacterium]|nr:hypothetical protein [Phycisphaerae bacterium]